MVYPHLGFRLESLKAIHWGCHLETLRVYPQKGSHLGYQMGTQMDYQKATRSGCLHLGFHLGLLRDCHLGLPMGFLLTAMLMATLKEKLPQRSPARDQYRDILCFQKLLAKDQYQDKDETQYLYHNFQNRCTFPSSITEANCSYSCEEQPASRSSRLNQMLWE